MKTALLLVTPNTNLTFKLFQVSNLSRTISIQHQK